MCVNTCIYLKVINLERGILIEKEFGEYRGLSDHHLIPACVRWVVRAQASPALLQIEMGDR